MNDTQEEFFFLQCPFKTIRGDNKNLTIMSCLRDANVQYRRPLQLICTQPAIGADEDGDNDL